MIGTPQAQNMLWVCVQEDMMHFPIIPDRHEAGMRATPKTGWDGTAGMRALGRLGWGVIA